MERNEVIWAGGSQSKEGFRDEHDVHFSLIQERFINSQDI